MKEDNGTITGHIGRHLRNRKIMDVYSNGERGKHAISHYTVLERFGYTTLVECRLGTGRTHQIRAHFKYIGHPLFNDSDYGGDNILKGTKFTKYKQFVQNCFKYVIDKPYMLNHLDSFILKHKKEFFLIQTCQKIAAFS